MQTIAVAADLTGGAVQLGDTKLRDMSAIEKAQAVKLVTDAMHPLICRKIADLRFPPSWGIGVRTVAHQVAESHGFEHDTVAVAGGLMEFRAWRATKVGQEALLCGALGHKAWSPGGAMLLGGQL